MSSTVSLLARYLLASALAAGALFSFLSAWAQWLFEQDSAASVPAAVRLVPFNSAYVARLAAWQSAQKVSLLHRAVELNPFDAESWIQLGFASEFQQHDPVQAERYFRHAADVDRMFLPKWTLTNFYFRHGRTREFFEWAKATLAISPYSPEPVFTQMWLVSQDARKIAEAIPQRPRILLPYAWFLSNNRQYATLPQTVQRLIDTAGSRNPHAWGRDDLLAAIEDRLVSEGNRQPALRVWESLAKAGWLQQNVPTAERPLTNGDFQTPLYRHGFDWIPATVDGVRLDPFAPAGPLRFEFSGNAPEKFVLLRQYLPLDAGRVYHFQWQAETQLAETPSGFTWHLRPVGNADSSDSVSADLGLSQSGDWLVRASGDKGISLLTLEYERRPGQLRARGILLLKSISASAASLH